MKELIYHSKFLGVDREHYGMLNDAFLARLDHVLMEKRGFEILRSGDRLGRYFWIWRCQNRWQGPRY
jgi:hypothetical protein